MDEINKLCQEGEGEKTRMESSLQGSFPKINTSKDNYCTVDGEKHGKRIQHLSQLCTSRKLLLPYGTLIIVIFMLVAMIILLAVTRHDPLPPLPPSERNQSCMDCNTLSAMVDKWAWKGISEDKQTGQCCFNSNIGLFSTLKSYCDTRLSSRQLETDQLQKDTKVLHNLVVNHLLKHNSNDTTIPQYTHPDLQTLIDLINNVFHRKRSVLHVTSLNTTIREGEDPRVFWRSSIRQGNLSLSNDSYSMTVRSTGLYFISTKVKFRASVFNNKTKDAAVQFYLGTLRRGQLSHVDDYKKRCVFSEKNIEHDAILHTMSRLEMGDKLIIRFPSSQNAFLASEPGAHRISMFEL